MKPALYYTIHSFHSYRYKVLAVTSEGPRGRVNGREDDDHPTHVRKSDCIGKFSSAADAKKYVDEIATLAAAHDEYREPLDKLIAEDYRQYRAKVHALLKEAGASAE